MYFNLDIVTKYVRLWKIYENRNATLSSQIYGAGKSRVIPDAMADVMKTQQFPYLLIDLTAKTEVKLRLRTNIWPGEIMTVYCVP
mgnify:CR=1 FL=1